MKLGTAVILGNHGTNVILPKPDQWCEGKLSMAVF